MRRLWGILVVALLGCAPRTGYVDMTKAMNDTAEGKAASASLTDFARGKSAEIKAARVEADKLRAAKADDDKIKAADQKAADIEREANAEFKQHQDASAARLNAGLARILPKLREAHGFVALDPKPLDVAPDLDVTAELVSRYNAGEGAEPPPDEVAAKKIADLEKTSAQQAKEIASLQAAKGVASNASKPKGAVQ